MRQASRLTGTDTLSAHVLRTVAAGAARRGLDAGALSARFGIEPSVLADPDGRVPAALLCRVWQEVPALVGDADFGLHLAEESGASGIALAGHLVLASRTLGDGIARVMAAGRLFNDVHTLEVRDEGPGAVALAVRSTGTAYVTPRHANEFAFAWVAVMARLATGRADLTAIEVRFEHAAPADTREHARVFGCPVRFSCAEAAAVVPRGLLLLETTSYDPALGEMLDAHARAMLARMPRGPEASARVRAVLAPRLRKGVPAVEEVAAVLGKSPRTLQRELAGEGTSYKGVVAALRRDMAEQHLADPSLDAADVALLVGFSDASAFHRAFVRWTGRSPGAFRRERRGG